jgi:hypothetical protein
VGFTNLLRQCFLKVQYITIVKQELLVVAKVNIKLSLYRPGQALRAAGV